MKTKHLQKKLIIFAAFLICSALSISCTHSTDNIESLPTVCFESEVLPIFQTNCAMSGCHSGTNAEAGYSCTNYASIMEKISPNSLSNSEAYQVITDTWITPMPPSPRKMLSQEQRTLISVWIMQGAEETKCTN